MTTRKIFITSIYYLLFVLSFMQFFTSCKTEKGKTIGALYISDEKPNPGDVVNIKYILPEKYETVEASYIYFRDTKSQPEDFEYTITNGVLNGKLKIPTKATALSLFFITPDGYNIGSNKGHLSYILPLYNLDGDLIPGAEASIAQRFLIYNKEIRFSLMLMKNDLERNPHLESKWTPIYLKYLYSHDNEEGARLIHKQIEKLEGKKDLNEEEYSTLITFFKTLKHKSKADSISNIAIKKFPCGKVRKARLTSAFEQDENLLNRIEIFKKYAATLDEYGYQEDTYRDYMLMRIAYVYIHKKDIKNFTIYTDPITNILMKSDLYNDMANVLLRNNERMSYAAKLCKRSLNILPTVDARKIKRLVTASKYREWISKCIKNSTSIYADILFKQGSISEAIKYKKRAVEDGNNGEINEKYIEYIFADNKFKEVRDAATRFIEMGTDTPKIRDLFKIAYLKNKGTVKECESYLIKVDKELHNKELLEYRKMMVNEKAPDFTLSNLDGEEITLSSLKGKTVILDFWANWCSPCKSSFRGMQMAIDKYKNNSSVVFLFINTYEKSPIEKRIKKTKDYLKSRDYTLNVLFDIQTDKGFEVSNKYKISVLPTKIIIGPKGNIMFKPSNLKEIGPVKLLKEFDIMIELTQS